MMLSFKKVRVAAVILLLQLVANGTRECLIHFTVVPTLESSSCLHCIDVNFNISSDVACCLAIDDIPDFLPKGGILKITFESNPRAFHLSKSMVFANLTQIEIRGPVPGIANVSCVKQGVGIMFDSIPSVTILNIQFRKCGAKYPSTVFNRGGKIVFFRTSLFFERCGNVQLNRTFVCYSPGFGVTMYDATGDCVIYESHFQNNMATANSSVVGGGGLYIEFTPRGGRTVAGNHSDVNIHISKCTFSSNSAGALRNKAISELSFGQLQGGGIFIRFWGSTTLQSFINIIHCQIINNTAEWGGGLHIEISNSTRNNTVHISDTVLANNTALTGGGGMVLYIKRNPLQAIAKVQITFKHCNFTWNWAGKYGGGSVLSNNLGSEFSTESYVLFDSCLWANNKANLFGSAVDTKFTTKKTYGILSQFKNCAFKTNWVLSTYKGDIFHEGRAAFMVSGSSVLFEGTTMFYNNNGSALYALSSKIQFSLGSHVNFIDNIGRNGGAIVLISSYLYIKNHVRLDFIQNKAYLKGGAIYSLSLGDFGRHRIYPYNCFLHSDDNIKSNRRNITLNFSNNSAAYTYGKYNGRSIYTTSLLSCTNPSIHTSKIEKLTKVLSQIASFKFPGSYALAQVVTSEAFLSIKENTTIHAIPGKEVELNISTRDEFDHIVPSSYQVFVRNRHRECYNFALKVDDRYKSLPNNQVKLYGSPGISCQISIEMEGNRQIYAHQRVTLEECPPGFILRNETWGKYPQLHCGCPTNSSEGYLGFFKCDENIFRTRINRGIWAGYDSNASEKALRVAHCPHSFCSYNNSSDGYSYLLPGIADQTILDKFVCEKGRTGKLCGSCRSGYSVHFHSPEYSCKRSDLCSLGWLLYIVSELVPLTIIFTIVLRFNINFTSGALTGFLFYAQIIGSLSVLAANEGRGYPNWTLAVIKVANFVYGFFNLNFFVFDTISFCLWEGAGTLDVITFKFVTIGFAFSLVLAVFLITNICTLTCRQHSLRISSQQSVIHGITAFLVVCLVQTIKVTFFVFYSATVYEKGGIISSYQAFYEGSFTYLRGKHLLYAIPSLLIAITIAFAPTFLLLWYPLVPRIIAKCGFGETKLVKISEKLLLINRLKPVIDSFQGSYKDNFRFFAGLLFLYRIVILASIAFSFDYTQSYILIQAQLTVMLLAQSLAQPYKETIHNILDSLLLFNLSIINILIIFISNMSLNSRYQLRVYVAAAAQALFTALPLLCLLVFVSKKILRRFVCCSNCKQAEQNEETDIPFRLLEESTESNDEDHSKMQD